MLPAKVVAAALVAAVSSPPPNPDAVRRVTDRPAATVRFLDRDRLAWLESDGRTVSGPVTVWDVPHGRAVHVLAGQPNTYRRGLAVWSRPNGEPRLVVADCEQNGRATVKAFDPRTGREVSRIEVPAAAPGGNMVQAVEPIANTGVLAVGSLDSFVLFWRGGDRDSKPDWQPADNFPICELAASPDGRLLAVGIDRPIVGVWDWATRKPAYTVVGRQEWGGLISFTFSPDGQFLAAGSFRGPVRIFDAATGHIQNTFDGRQSAAQELTFSPDSRTLGVVHDDGTLVIWELLTGKPRVRVRFDMQTRSVAAAPTGGLLAVAGGKGVRVYDPWAGPVGPLSDVAMVWSELGSSEADVGFRAMRQLARRPAADWDAVRARLPALPDAARSESVDRMVRLLDIGDFGARIFAEAELGRVGYWAERRLRAARESAKSDEVRSRLDRVLAQLGKPAEDRNLVRLARLVEVLERVETDEAGRLLRDIAGRYPDCPFAQPTRAPLPK